MLVFNLQKDHWLYEESLKCNMDVLYYLKKYPLLKSSQELWLVEYGCSDGYSE